MKNAFFIPILILSIFIKNTVFSQFKTFEEAKNDVFGNLDFKKIETGILYNAGFYNNNFRVFDSKNEKNISNYRIWAQCYNQIYKSFMIKPSIPVIKDVYEKVKSLRNDKVVPVGILNFDYDVIKENALNDKLIIYKNNKLFNSFKRESPYKKENLFVTAPLIDSCFSESGEINFILSRQFFFTNIDIPIDEIEINFDDGNGFIPVNFDDVISINYSYIGKKIIKLKLYTKNQIFFSKSELLIYNDTNNNLKTGDVGTYNIPDEIITSINDIKIGVWYACENHQILKPIIFVEGFDPLNKKSLTNTHDEKNLWAVTTTSKRILEKLQEKGYDIFLIDFDENAADLNQSALKIADAINYINSMKESEEEIIIGGRSGGGLLSRYALAYMEGLNMEHQTKLLLEIDSENQGANISLGYQHFVKDLLLNPSLSDYFGYDINFLNRYYNKTLNSPYARQILFYHCSATNISEKKAHSTAEHICFFETLKGLNNHIGYPTKVKRVALSNSGKNGQHQGVTYSQLFDDLHFPLNTQCQGFKISGLAYALPDYNSNGLIYESKLQIRFLIVGCIFTSWVTLYSNKIYVNNTIPYDDATGSYLAFHSGNGSFNFLDYLPDVTVASEHECFVPISSSLDLDANVLPENHGGIYCSIIDNIKTKPNIIELNNNIFLNLQPFNVTPFDVFLINNNNNEHITSNPNWINLLDNQLYPENIFLQNQNVNYNQNFYAENNLFAGRNVTDAIPQGNFVIKENKKVVFTAKNSVILENGFETEDNAEFTAQIINIPDCSKNERTNYNNYQNYAYEDTEKSETMYSDISDIIINSEKPVSIYPNPSDGKFFIVFNYEQKTPVQIDVYDFKGIHIFSKKSSNRSLILDLTNNLNGMYLLKLIVNNKIYTKKIFLTK